MTTIVVQKGIKEIFGYLEIIDKPGKIEKLKDSIELLGLAYDLEYLNDNEAYIKIFSDKTTIDYAE